jgi:hypothetical protein
MTMKIREPIYENPALKYQAQFYNYYYMSQLEFENSWLV